jgi:uncharacterized membrane protein YhhN
MMLAGKSTLLDEVGGVTFAACSVLIILSVFVGIQEYRTALRQYETATQLSEFAFSSRRYYLPNSSI